MHVLYEKNWTTSVLEPIRKLESNMMEEILRGEHSRDLQRAILRNEQQWSLTSSLFYAITIITTTGNNGLYVTTTSSKLATIAYAIVGVPLTFFCFSNMGILWIDLLHYLNCAMHSDHDTTDDKAITNCDVCERNKHKYGYKIVNNTDAVESNEQNVHPTKKDMIVRVNRRRTHENLIIHQTETYCTREQAVAIKLQPTKPTIGVCKSNENGIVVNKKHIRFSNHQRITANNINSKSAVKNKSIKMPRLSLLRNQSAAEYRISNSAIFFILFGYICVSATIYALWKKKPFFEGVYFCFLSLFTVNFNNKISASTVGLDDLVAYCLYFLIGLPLLASIFYIVRENFLKSRHQNVSAT